jgi:hypothetical protein
MQYSKSICLVICCDESKQTIKLNRFVQKSDLMQTRNILDIDKALCNNCLINSFLPTLKRDMKELTRWEQCYYRAITK